MFGKKKKELNLFNAVDDSRTTVYDFRLRSTEMGFESYRTAQYKLYHKLAEAEMLPRLDEHLEKLLAGEVDDANGDMLDAIIFGAAREAKPELGIQHYDHGDLLRRLTIRHDTDKDDLARIIENREKELELMEADHEKTCNLAAANA